MKRFSAILILLVFATILMADIIHTDFSFTRPDLEVRDGYTEIIMEKCVNLGDEGYPSLPRFSAEVLLPPGHELEMVNIISTEFIEIDKDLTVKPAARQFPISVKIDDNYKVIPNQEIYNSSGWYPEDVITPGQTHFLSGHAIAIFGINPIRYYPTQNKVEYLSEIVLEIKTGPTARANQALDNLKYDNQIQSRISAIVRNPDLTSAYFYPENNRDDEYDILLISNQALLPSFDEYIAFKQSTGYIIATETIENIYSNYTGQDNAEKVRNCIIDYYQNYNIDYVILGGDSDGNDPANAVVPHRGFSVLDDPTLPSDLYFSGLDGTWNDDGDGYWGESNEIDTYSEISVGRICVDMVSEIENSTHKLYMYQDQPVVDDIEKALMIGEELNDSPWTFGGDYKDQIVYGSSANGYTTVGISENFTVNTLYDRDFNWGANDLYEQFNDIGINLVNHLGHSNPTYNMKISNSDLTTYNFTNDGVTRGYPIGYSQGCYNGSFDNWHFSGFYTEDCFAEKFSGLETGEVACIANSRYGWYQPGGTNSSSQYYDRQFYDAIFGQEVTKIGDTNRRSKEVDVNLMISDGYYRWVAYETNLFGDPSMDIWTAIPTEIYANYPVSIPIGSSEINFQTDSPFARIALIQNEELIGRGVADETGICLVTAFETIQSPEIITVSIIGHNKIRHQGSIVVVSDQPYIIYDSHQISDESGNNNQQPDYSEEISLDVSFYNVGNQLANNVTAQLLIDDEYIELLDGEEDLGTVAAETIITIEDAFSFQIADIIADQHRSDFTLEITGDRDQWTSYFSIFLCAPVLSPGEMIVNDVYGNDNGILDPGETAQLTIQTNNIGHADSPQATASLSCNNEDITISEVVTDLGIILAEGSALAVYEISADPEMTIGTPILLNYEVECQDYEEYNLEHTYLHTVGLILEDFESGDFNSYNWQMGGDANWSIDTNSYEGNYSAQTGSINNNSSTSLMLELEVLIESEFSFFKKVSSEANYDYFYFILDGQEMGAWSGEIDWSEEAFVIPSGSHTMEWKYEKDGYMTSGSDCAWIDYVIMPVIAGLDPAQVCLNQEEFSFQIEQGDTGTQILEITNEGEADLHYYLSVDYPEPLRDEGGPDEFGYLWEDSNDPDGPVYSWRDISDVGTMVTFTHNDVGTDLMPIGFTFEFYGVEYDEFLINPNGWIGFGEDNWSWSNTTIPDPEAPAPAVMPFWDDLNPAASGGEGEVYYYSTSDSLVVWFNDIIHYVGDYNGTYDFQVIIYPDGSIIYQYRSLSGDLDTCTVGIQNEDGTVGLQVAFNEPYLEEQLAIKIRKVDLWFSISDTNGILTSGQTDFVELLVDPADMEIGNYNCNLVISSNDPDNSLIYLPINLEVTATDYTDDTIPSVTGLIGNYPNPFNPETKIQFGVTETSHVVLEIYNIKGQKVTTLVDNMIDSGYHEVVWQGNDNAGKPVTSGVYFYRLQANKYSGIKKMLLLK